MAGEFKLISTDQLFAKIEDQLNSYVANGILDVGRFYNEVKWFIQKLGIGAYDFDDAIWAQKDQDPLNKDGFHLIVAIADVFDALGSERVYKKAWEDEKIFELFNSEKGEHFDPKVITAFFDSLDEIKIIRERFKDI